MAINTVGELKKFIENIDHDTRVRIYTEDGETHNFLISIISKETLTEEEYVHYDKDELPMLMLHI
jgi:hypothetical protein